MWVSFPKRGNFLNGIPIKQTNFHPFREPKPGNTHQVERLSRLGIPKRGSRRGGRFPTLGNVFIEAAGLGNHRTSVKVK